jgi:hypothetical protein
MEFKKGAGNGPFFPAPGFTALPLDPHFAVWAVRLFHRFLP